MISIAKHTKGTATCNACNAANYVRYGQAPAPEQLYEMRIAPVNCNMTSVTILCAPCLRELRGAAHDAMPA